MSELSEEILSRIREFTADAKKTRSARGFRKPGFEDIAPDTQILAFDQSLSHCGWALVNTEDGNISIPESGTIRAVNLGTSVRGFELTMTKTIVLARSLSDVLTRLYGQWESVVLEMPAVMGFRTESSLVAASTVCSELNRMGEPLPAFVSRQAAGSDLVGDRYAPKSLSSAFVNELVEDRRPKGNGQWTEHVRDAVFVGLKHLLLENR